MARPTYYFFSGMKFYFGSVGSYRMVESVFPEEVTFRVIHKGKTPDKRTKTITKKAMIAWSKRHKIAWPKNPLVPCGKGCMSCPK